MGFSVGIYCYRSHLRPKKSERSYTVENKEIGMVENPLREFTEPSEVYEVPWEHAAETSLNSAWSEQDYDLSKRRERVAVHYEQVGNWAEKRADWDPRLYAVAKASAYDSSVEPDYELVQR